MTSKVMESKPPNQNSPEVTASQQKLHREEISLLTEKARELKVAAHSGNWILVDDLVSVDDVTRCDIEQSYLLHKLAAASEVSLSLARDILTKILKHKVDIDMMDNDQDTALVLAAKCENAKMVMELLSRQASLPQDEPEACSFLQTLTEHWDFFKTPYMHALIIKLLWDRLKDTALHRCHTQLHHTLVRLAVTFHTSLVRHMFVTQQQVNAVDSEGMAVLHRLAMLYNYDSIRLVHFLISRGADINLPNNSGFTPLHVAAKCLNWEMMEALLHLRAKSDMIDCEQRSVLHIMALYTDTTLHNDFGHLFPLLIQNSSDINKRDGEGNTALHLAALAENILFMKTLLDHGARADGVNNKQKTVLHMMAMTCNETSSNIELYSSVFLLTVKRGADIQKRDIDGNWSLHLSIKQQKWDLVKLLLRYVDEAFELDSEGFNILHRCVMIPNWYDRDILYRLSQKVGNINTKCQTGDSPIHLAAKFQNWDIVKQLVEEGALINELDNEGFHILHRMSMGKYKQDYYMGTSENSKNALLSLCLKKVINCNIRCPAGDTVLSLAAKHDNWFIVQRILECVEDADEVDSEGFTVMQRLVMSLLKDHLFSHFSLFCRLLELGADYTCRDQNGDTVLHLAARNGHWDIVQYLVELGEETDTPDSEGFVILHRVATADIRHSTVRNVFLSLLQPQHVLDKRTKHGDTAIHLAAKNEKWEMFATLIEHGANPLHCDSEGTNGLERMVISPSASHIFNILAQTNKLKQHSSAYGELLYKAARFSNWDVVQYLVNQGFSIHQHDLEGLSLLHIVVTRKTPEHLSKILHEIILCLLDKGHGLEDTCPDGNTALNLAAKSDNWGAVKCLVEQGANIHSPDNDGYFLLQRLAMNKTFDNVHLELLQLLIKKGADLKVHQSSGDSLLHLAAKANNWGFVFYIIMNTSELDLNELDSDSFNILHRLAQSHKSSEWVIISGKEFDIGALNRNGDTCLLLAARRENWNFVKSLLGYINKKQSPVVQISSDVILPRFPSSDVTYELPVPEPLQGCQVEVKLNLDKKDVCGYTVWHYAFMTKQWDVILELARCGVDTDHVDDEGLNILQRMASDMTINFHSIHFTKDSVLHLFKEDGLGNCPLQTAAARNISLEMVTLLLDHIRDVHSKDSDGIPLLHRVVHRTYVRSSSEFQEIVERLLNLGADVEEQSWDGNRPLHLAAKCVNWSVVRLLLKHGARAGVCDSEGLCVLHILACQNPTLPHIAEKHSSASLAPLISELLQSGASLNQKDFQGNTPLHLAVQHQNWEVAQEFVHCGAEVNELNPDGYTVLHRLAQVRGAGHDQSFLSLLQLLFGKGASCDITSNGGETIFNILVENESWSMLKCLLTNGMAVINKQDYQSLFYSLTSSHYGDVHTDVCDLLIEKGLSVDAKDGDEDTALNRASWAGNWRLVEHLIQKGASGRFVDKMGLSILHRFVNDRSSDIDSHTLEVIDVIISSGVDVNVTDPRGNTALHTAARFGLFEIVDHLLNYAENLNTRDSDGLTLLLRLSHSSSPKCLPLVERLVQQGADINVCSTDGESPLHLAIEIKNWSVVEFLLNRGAQVDVQVLDQLYTLHRLITCSSPTFSDDRQLKLMKMLTQKGVSVNGPDLNEKTPAELAVMYGKWDLLLNILPCVLNLNQNDRKGNSFFHELAKDRSLHAEKVDIIIYQLTECGLDINQQNSIGYTPAHLAADEDNHYIVRIFVAHGADTNIPNRKGNCLLHTVVRKLSRESIPYQRITTDLVSLLVRHGADINRRGADNKTALQMAAGQKDWGMVGGLVELGATCELTPEEKQSAFAILHHFPWEEIEENKLRSIIKYITEDVTDINYSFSDRYTFSAPKSVLQGCIENSKWRMAKVLVECGAEVNEPFIQLMICRYSLCDRTKWINFLDFLISRGFDINAQLSNGSTLLLFDETINSLLFEHRGTGSLFDTLLKKGADPLLVDSKGQTLLRKIIDLDGYSKINGLKKLLPTGVTTYQPQVTQTMSQSQEFSEYTVSPTEKMIQDHNRLALNILIQSGASSNAELFRLNTEYQVKFAAEADTNYNVRELLRDLNIATSKPRPLKSLCRLAVSHCLGCGSDRMDKIQRLDIPLLLKRLACFVDLLELLT